MKLSMRYRYLSCNKILLISWIINNGIEVISHHFKIKRRKHRLLNFFNKIKNVVIFDKRKRNNNKMLDEASRRVSVQATDHGRNYEFYYSNGQVNIRIFRNYGSCLFGASYLVTSFFFPQDFILSQFGYQK